GRAAGPLRPGGAGLRRLVPGAALFIFGVDGLRPAFQGLEFRLRGGKLPRQIVERGLIRGIGELDARSADPPGSGALQHVDLLLLDVEEPAVQGVALLEDRSRTVKTVGE